MPVTSLSDALEVPSEQNSLERVRVWRSVAGKVLVWFFERFFGAFVDLDCLPALVICDGEFVDECIEVLEFLVWSSEGLGMVNEIFTSFLEHCDELSRQSGPRNVMPTNAVVHRHLYTTKNT